MKRGADAGAALGLLVPDTNGLVATGRQALLLAAQALMQCATNLDEQFDAAVALLAGARGRVVVTGIGKSGHVGRKIAATLASVGKPAFFLHASEASHGDLGMIDPGDVVLALSNSGASSELFDVVAYCNEASIDIVAITQNRDSPLGRAASVTLSFPQVAEACALGLAPTTSTTVMMALGDAIAVSIMSRLGIGREEYRRWHPGGRLGASLVKVSHIMHRGESLPIVPLHMPMADVVVEMSAKGFGIAIVEDQLGELIGVITDGDMRRNVSNLWSMQAKDVAHTHPVTITEAELVTTAVSVMEEARITCLPVIGAAGRVTGLVHIHDCLRTATARN